jgi:hypothetical protein
VIGIKRGVGEFLGRRRTQQELNVDQSRIFIFTPVEIVMVSQRGHQAKHAGDQQGYRAAAKPGFEQSSHETKGTLYKALAQGQGAVREKTMKLGPRLTLSVQIHYPQSCEISMTTPRAGASR